MSLLAQFSTPSEGLSSSYYSPLILAGLLYLVLFVAARVLEGRGDPRAETVEDAGFVVMLLAASTSRSSRSWRSRRRPS